jgi:hypothetical protein
MNVILILVETAVHVSSKMMASAAVVPLAIVVTNVRSLSQVVAVVVNKRWISWLMDLSLLAQMKMALEPPSVVATAETYPVKVPGTRLSVQVEEWWSEHARQTLIWTLMWLSTAPREANAVISLA